MPRFEVLGLYFGISRTEAKDTFHYWLEILGNVLPASLLEQVEKHDRDYVWVPTQNKYELVINIFMDSSYQLLLPTLILSLAFS